MHVLLVASILLVRAATTAPSTGLPAGAETPRATDLLRAKRMADEAASRLDLHPPKRGGWARGGGGWTSRDAPAAPKGGLSTSHDVR